MGQLDATFGGHHLDGEAAISFVMALGPTPNVNSLTVVGQETTWQSGSLVLTDGVETITLTNLEPFSWHVRNGAQGIYTEIQIRDSRQRWQTRGQITGEYNKPEADGQEKQEKTVRELVALCLAALGEATYDVAALPDDFYPYVRWEWAKPGVEATRLADMCQCVLGLDANGRPKVYKLGQGQAIPAGYKEKHDLGRQSTFRPALYVVRGAQTIVQRTSTLDPVGLDTDGTIKALADLSYMGELTAKWGTVQAAVMNHFRDWFGTPKYEAAIKSIWKWFRVPAADQKYLPALAKICETKTENGKTIWLKPRVSSPDSPKVKDKQSGQWVAVSDLNSRDWDLDEQLGVVKFKDGAVIKTGGAVAAVQLTWAHRELNAQGLLTDQCFYNYLSDPNAPLDAATEVIEAEWLQLRIIIADGVETVLNADDLDAVAAKIISYIDPGDSAVDSAEVVYSGLKYIYPDGRVRQVTWHIGSDGATTTILYNTERPRFGGARLERKVEALKKAHQLAESGAAAARANLSGSATPESAAPQKQDPVGAYTHHDPEARFFVNDTGAAAEEGDILWRSGALDAKGVEIAELPSFGGVSNCALAAGAIPDGTTGLAWIAGVHPIRCADWASVTPGDRLGAQKGSPLAVVDDCGPWLVTGKLASPLVLAERTRIRADHLIVTDGAPRPRVVQHLRFSPLNYRLHLAQGGVCVVTQLEEEPE